MAGLQDKLQDGGDWAGETIKSVRKLKEIVVSDDKQASCASFAASLGPRMPPNILPMNLIAAPATADARCFKFQNDCTGQIIGYIERDGTVTNTSRQLVEDIELD